MDLYAQSSTSIYFKILHEKCLCGAACVGAIITKKALFIIMHYYATQIVIVPQAIVMWELTLETLFE